MSQSNFDPNQDPYQQNPQPNQGQQPYPPGYNPQQPSQGYPQPGYGQPVYVIQQPTDVNNMAMLAHLSGIAGFLIPLIFWAVYKDKPGYERVRNAAARAFNLGVTMVITYFQFIPAAGSADGNIPHHRGAKPIRRTIYAVLCDVSHTVASDRRLGRYRCRVPHYRGG